MYNLVDFFEIAERLECEYRLTRMSDGAQQSVAAHSWNMAMMAMVLQPYFQNDYDIISCNRLIVHRHQSNRS